MKPALLRSTTPATRSVCGTRADKHEHGSGRHRTGRAGDAVAEREGLQPFGAVGLGHLGAHLHLDVGRAGDLVDEVLRHAGLQALAAHEHGHLAGEAGEEHRSLAGGVGAANHEDRLAAIVGGLGQRRAVVDAGAGQPLDARARPVVRTVTPVAISMALAAQLRAIAEGDVRYGSSTRTSPPPGR